MKILFLDHVFHRKTKSSNFFMDLIKENFDWVDVEYVDTECPSDIKALRSKRIHDLVIIWQLDYLAPIFLAAGYRTVVVPMYDGSANMPYEHWIGMSRASFVNFSRTLHERVIAAGCRSLTVKYFLPPVEEGQLPTFENLRGILWMRRPQDGLTPKLVQRMLDGQLTSLHVHNAPDDGNPRKLSEPEYETSAFQITESHWVRDTNAYLAALPRCNVFVAPRMSEGIGMAMLEAFSRGLLVIANDDAVHNEYVSNWVNGILFNLHNVGPFHVSSDMARDMAVSGWYGALSGYLEWLESRRQIVEFIRDTPEPASVTVPVSPAYTTALWDAYLLGGDSYRHFLREHVVNWDSRDTLQRIASSVRSLINIETRNRPLLDEDGLFFGTSSRSIGNKHGFSAFDAFSALLAKQSAGFSIKIGEVDNLASDAAIVLKCCLLEMAQEGWKVLVHINRELCLRLPLNNLPEEFEIRIPVCGIRGSDLDVLLSFVNFELEDQTVDLPRIKFFCVKLERYSDEIEATEDRRIWNRESRR